MGIRTEIYQILSECYKEPSIEFAEDVARGYLHREISTQFARLGIALSLEGLGMAGDPTEVLKTLKDQYYPLFMGPFPPFVLPVESVYKEWARQGTAPLIAPEVRGMLMGEPAIDMMRRYRLAGIEIPKEFKDMPDHLALLLEYRAWLCENETDREQKRFVQDHLDWLPEFRRLIYACTESRSEAGRFYRTVADVTAAAADEQRVLGKEGKPHELLDTNVGPP